MQSFAFNLSQKNLRNTGSRFNLALKITDKSSFLTGKNFPAPPPILQDIFIVRFSNNKDRVMQSFAFYLRQRNLHNTGF
jgi:hypothetical protein